MRNILILLAVLVVGLIACTGCDDDGKLKPGEFGDPAFKACVENKISYAELDKNDPDLYDKITSMECYGGGIKSLKGIENMPNMDWLAIVDNQIELLEPLHTLTKLDWLKLNNNKIKDITPISNLPALR
jgi:Leucine-rich repeat (LRR) protein